MDRPTQAELADRFRALHRPGRPLLMPNPWDLGSAAIMRWLGFEALATTSSGYAATLGRLDGDIDAAMALEHAAQLAAGTELPVSADLENGFADTPEGVAETARGAVAAGLAGFSIEDYTGDDTRPFYERDAAAARIAAAAEVAHAGPARLVLTARAENHIRGNDDLDDTIARLRAYEQAGADVVFAPGVIQPDQIRAVCEAVSLPVSVLVRPGAPTVSELAALGVARVSVGGALAFAAIEALVSGARELLEDGTFEFLARAGEGGGAARQAFRVDE